MTAASKPPLDRSTRLVAWALALAGAVRIVDFVFYGQHLNHLLAGLGFALLAFGTYRDGLVAQTNDTTGRRAAVAGALLAIASLLVVAVT